MQANELKIKVMVLGCGLVGKTIAGDLRKNFEVTVVDFNTEILKEMNSNGFRTLQADLSDSNTIKEIIKDHELVVGAVPGFIGYNLVKAVIEAGKNIVDISFFPEDQFTLEQLAIDKGVTAILDCGLAPGMGNIILGYHNANMEVHEYECLVGGLPVEREWPYEYKAVFSPGDVIEEYVRPARFVKNGGIVIREALSDPELVNFEKVGTLEAWNSDGLRSLLKTMKIPNMIEKTLRYPGTIEYLRVLRDTGFFSSEQIEVKGIMIRPVDLTSKLLFPKWKLKPGEKEFTVMRIIISGIENGDRVKYTYSLYDEYDPEAKQTSMARTTGFTCNAAVNLLARKKFDQKGLILPEYLGTDRDNFDFILNYLKERNVDYQMKRGVE
ncbi:MAG TPA: saccharopine dehydrogenase C-terminal domain-containing protein [Cyclobacteriaceae bacterium]|jgi:saccharopine dehydrogenase-like NADP-dependent oxidoreductase